MQKVKQALRAYFESLPVYSPALDETIQAVVSHLEDHYHFKKGSIISELGPDNNDFWFLHEGLLKEMYKNTYQNNDTLFNIIPSNAIFVNEDTLFLGNHPQHYFVAYTDVQIVRFSQESFSEVFEKYPLIQLLYVSGTAEIQKNRRARLTMLRMSKTIDRVNWVRAQRPDLYKNMDRITLAQYIGVSRASLYRAFEKNGRYQF